VSALPRLPEKTSKPGPDIRKNFTRQSRRSSTTVGEIQTAVIFLTRTTFLREEAAPTEEAALANPSAKEIPDMPPRDSCSTEKLDLLNYCIPGMLSRCGAGPKAESQKLCRYYKKSTIREQCMHYIVVLNGHCDCVDAQRDVRRPRMIEDD